jgi:hypothetical protein
MGIAFDPPLERAPVPQEPTRTSRRPPTATSLPIKFSLRLRCPCQPGANGQKRYRRCSIRTLVEQGGKLVDIAGIDVAGETMGLSVLRSYYIFFTDVVAAALKDGWTGYAPGDKRAKDKALDFLLAQLQRPGGRASVCPLGPLYLHTSGTPGRPEFFASMHPVAVVRTKDIFMSLPRQQRETHWLASRIPRKFRRNGHARVKNVPVYEAFPYMLVADAPWNIDTTAFPVAQYEAGGRLGAPGSCWQIVVEEHSG